MVQLLHVLKAQHDGSCCQVWSLGFREFGIGLSRDSGWWDITVLCCVRHGHVKRSRTRQNAAKATEDAPGMSWAWRDKHDTCPHALICERGSVFDCCLGKSLC